VFVSSCQYNAQRPHQRFLRALQSERRRYSLLGFSDPKVRSRRRQTSGVAHFFSTLQFARAPRRRASATFFKTGFSSARSAPERPRCCLGPRKKVPATTLFSVKRIAAPLSEINRRPRHHLSAINYTPSAKSPAVNRRPKAPGSTGPRTQTAQPTPKALEGARRRSHRGRSIDTPPKHSHGTHRITITKAPATHAPS